MAREADEEGEVGRGEGGERRRGVRRGLGLRGWENRGGTEQLEVDGGQGRRDQNFLFIFLLLFFLSSDWDRSGMILLRYYIHTAPKY